MNHAYLDIEQARFTERLTVNLEINPLLEVFFSPHLPFNLLWKRYELSYIQIHNESLEVHEVVRSRLFCFFVCACLLYNRYIVASKPVRDITMVYGRASFTISM